MEHIYRRCKEKMQHGIDKYGEYSPDTDTRDLLDESIEELIDAINYILMHRIKMEGSDLYLKDVELGLVNLIARIESKK